MDIEDDIIIIQDNRPQEPREDPLEVNQYNSLYNDQKLGEKTRTDHIINLGSSDDEIEINSPKFQESTSPLKDNAQHETQNFTTDKNSDGNILHTSLQHPLNESPPHTNIIDLDAEDLDLLAPQRLFINSSQNKKETNTIINSRKNTTNKMITLANSSKKGPNKYKIIKVIKSPLVHSTKSTEKPITIQGLVKTKNRSPNWGKPSDKSLKTNIFRQLEVNINGAERSLEPSTTELNIMPTNDGDKIINKNLTYLGKIIRIPGQPSLIENSSGLIFRAKNNISSLESVGTNNLETEANLYQNFFKCANNDTNNAASRQNLQKISTQNVQVEDIFIKEVKTSVNTSKNMDNQLKKKLEINSTSTSIPSKKEKLIMSTSRSIKEQTQRGHVLPVIIPYQPQDPSSTILDLNLNINDTEPSSTANMTNIMTPSMSDSTGRYNLALGLVLNVNDNQQNNLYRADSQSQFKSLNNVALDVSFNLNKQEKPATITNEQAQQNVLPPFAVESTNKDGLNGKTSNLVRKTYCCCRCPFKTDYVGLVGSHLCPLSSSVNAVSSLKKPLHTYINKSSTMKTYSKSPRKEISDIFCCNVCSFKSLDLELMKLHDCTCSTIKKNEIAHDQQHVKLNCNGDNFSVGKIYCCVACSFKTSDFEIMKSHNCPSVNKVLKNPINRRMEPNLKYIGPTVKNSIVETDSRKNLRVPTIYKCAACTFQTTDLEVINFHECFLINKKNLLGAAKNIQSNTLGKKRGKQNQITFKSKSTTAIPNDKNQTKKIYSCISCSFKTSAFELAQAHRCKSAEKDNNLTHLSPHLQNPLNKLDKSLEPTSFPCELCKTFFKTKYTLFQHLRKIHFDFQRLFQCCLCNTSLKNIGDLLKHCTAKHHVRSEESLSLMNKEMQCRACGFRTKYLKDVKIHFDKHIENYQSIMKLSWRFGQDDDLNESQQTRKQFLYECKLCGKKSNSFPLWFTHVCKKERRKSIACKKRKDCIEKQAVHTDQIEFIDGLTRIGRIEAPVIPTQISKRRPRLLKSKRANFLLCFYCKRQIIGKYLKCDNSDCEHLYHLECVECYGRLMDPEELESLPSWFCIDCSTEILPIPDDIDNISRCLDFADKECLLEVEKQKSMVADLKTIKKEKETMKEEFHRIKKFIMECKSERINNDGVKNVCAIVESFINAGVDGD